MRNLTLLFLSLFIFSFQWLNAQQPIYSKIKIHLNGPEDMRRLGNLGLETEHGQYKEDNFFISYFSQHEIELIKNAGFLTETLVEDASLHFQKQNATSFKDQSAAGALSCQPGNNSSYKTPDGFSFGSMGGYFTYQEMLAHLDTMAARFPHLITARATISNDTTHEGRPLHWLKISDNAVQDEPEPEMLYTALHHAREPASLSQLIFYMYYLLENYGTDDRVTYLVNNSELYFIPCVNPDGYVYNQTTNPNGGGFWRKNRRDNLTGDFGVDLNRNYGFHWGFDDAGSSPVSSSEIYRGPVPFSEPETRMVRDFCLTHDFEMALNYHTYGELLIYPWGYIPSFLTPDSTLFSLFAQEMIRENKYTAGTGDQVLNYITNGDSDDWMYGEQTLKNKIYSLTPEAGTSFWDPANKIIDICTENMHQNLTAAELMLDYAILEDISPYFLTGNIVHIPFNLQKLGFRTGAYSISILPISSNIVSTSGAVSLNSLSQLQIATDSIQLQLHSSIKNGNEVAFAFALSNGTYTRFDTIRKIFGAPNMMLVENADSAQSWIQTWGWGLDQGSFLTTPSSYGDSPFGDYGPNSMNELIIDSILDLTNAIAATLSFYAKWEIEANYDYAQVMIATSTGGFNNWTSLCGKYTVEGGFDQDYGNPLYHNFQTDWVKEEIDLSDYSGKKVKLKFRLVSDGFVEKEGFNFDDLKIEAILKTDTVTGISEANPDPFKIYPNPATHKVTIEWTESTPAGIVILDMLGSVIEQHDASSNSKAVFSTENWPAGIYFCKLSSGSNVRQMKFSVIGK